MTSSQKTIFVADDHPIIIEGIDSLLSGNSVYKLIGFTHTTDEILYKVENLNPDILIIDLNMPGENSAASLTRLVKQKYAHIKVICLSMHGSYGAVSEMINAGISGYILKNAAKNELLEALNKITEGKSYYSQEITQELIKAGVSNPSGTRLTNREIEIVKLIGKELNNKQIAEKLFLSERTVESHRKNIFRKTGAQGIVGLIKYAFEHKLIE